MAKRELHYPNQKYVTRMLQIKKAFQKQQINKFINEQSHYSKTSIQLSYNMIIAIVWNKHHEMKQRRDMRTIQIDNQFSQSHQQIDQSLHTHLKEEIYQNEDSELHQEQIPNDNFLRIKLETMQQQKHHEMKQGRSTRIKQLDNQVFSNQSHQQFQQLLHTQEEIYQNEDSELDQDQIPTDKFQRIKEEPIMNDYMKQEILDPFESDIFVKQEPQMINYENQQEFCFQDEVYIPDYSDYQGEFQYYYEDYQN